MQESATAPLAVAFVTLGCAKNEVDSLDMAKRLASAGISVVDDVETADCIVVNTCSFIQEATEESIAAILEVSELSSVASGRAKLIVAGCMPARYGKDLEGELHEASAFVPCSHEDDIVQIIQELFPTRYAKSVAQHIDGSPSAYIKISDGCDRFCSFCTIPFIRGRYHSFSFEQINRNVQEAIDAGAKEVVLIAQDTGRWGQDFDEPSDLSWLVQQLAQRYSDTWIRIMYVQPEGVSDELLKVMSLHDNVCSYIDVPFQHCNETLLASMNRRGSYKEYLSLIEHIRSMVPGVVIRTTLIAGYPGESDDDFDELVSFVEDAELDYVGVFAYSQEDGTRAAKMNNQIDEDTKLERAQTLRDVADSISHQRVAQRIGQELDVLVLGCEEDGQVFGRAMCQAPDVDGVVYIESSRLGQIVRTRITDTLLYEMEGEEVDNVH